MANQAWVNRLALLLGFLHLNSGHGFRSSIAPISNRLGCESFLLERAEPSDGDNAGTDNLGLNRRRALLSWGVAATGLYLPRPALAEEKMVTSSAVETLLEDSLSDLPPLADGYVRLYLCRHGQTENNRLNKVQGARVDPDINDTGREQARRLGIALTTATIAPAHIYHSPLQRAQQTAELAASQVNGILKKPTKSSIKTSTLDMIQEIDFGPAAEGVSVAPYRAKMRATYARWSVGDFDARMTDGGENGEDVLRRIEQALVTLHDLALTETNRCVAAVAHSAYLKVLLAVVGTAADTSDTKNNLLASLARVATLQQSNCAVNVIDLSAKKTATIEARAGGDSQSLRLKIPEGRIVRVNEGRHLGKLA